MSEIVETNRSASSCRNFRMLEKLIEKIINKKWSIKFY